MLPEIPCFPRYKLNSPTKTTPIKLSDSFNENKTKYFLKLNIFLQLTPDTFLSLSRIQLGGMLTQISVR